MFPHVLRVAVRNDALPDYDDDFAQVYVDHTSR